MSGFDLIVVGGGHAGCEAALAGLRMGCRVALITFKKNRIAVLSCNPAIGGTAKGQLVREIDALGGQMGLLIDQVGIHFRILGRGKGPAMHSPRAQADSKDYAGGMQRLLESLSGLELIEGEVVQILSEPIRSPARRGASTFRRRVVGVCLRDGRTFSAPRIVVTSGTFLNGLMHFGFEKIAGGRIGDPPAEGLSDSLRSLGLSLGRLKTGTTPRLDRSTVRTAELEAQPGDEPAGCFSFRSCAPIKNRVVCHLTHTTRQTHQIIRDNLHRSPLFTKEIVGIGPRYCPSIEDKVVRFESKDGHQVFVEPEGVDSDRVYPNGIPTSLPKDVQVALVRSIPGFEEAVIRVYGYAVEYDFVPPTQLYPWLETKVAEGLFLAGQINGTSGYEEAAAQGLLAGINAVLTASGGGEPLVLSREEAYAGVLIDDLVTKGTNEPYRLFTSRAEYRLCLRAENADERLMKYGYRFGLIPDSLYRESHSVAEAARLELKRLEKTFLRPSPSVQYLLEGVGTRPLQAPIPYAVLLRRPKIHIGDLEQAGFQFHTRDPRVLERVEIEAKYAGYVERQRRDLERTREMENLEIPSEICYRNLQTVSNEARQKFEAVRPRTLGQAARVPGVSPADVAALLVAVRKTASSTGKGRLRPERAAPRGPMG